MKVKYVDAHCHVQFEQYDADREAVIEKMREEGIVGIVVGCDFDSSKKAVELAEKYDHLYASIGLHPNNYTDEQFDIEKYRALASSARVVAVGECGLDYYRPTEVNDELKAKQKELLNHHILLAAELDKPLIIHSRPSKGTVDAYRDLIEILKKAKVEHPNLRGDIHFFVGGVAEAEELIKLGFTVSFTAVITFARDYHSVIKTVALENILSETDSPYLAPKHRRGERNDPLAVVDVVNKIAEIRGEDPENVRVALAQNAKRLFTLPVEA